MVVIVKLVILALRRSSGFWHRDFLIMYNFQAKLRNLIDIRALHRPPAQDLMI